MILQKRRKIA